MTGPRAAAAALTLAIALLAAAPALGYDISSADLAELASSADPASVAARLEGVTSIDGQPVDIDRLLGNDPQERAARLAELGRLEPAPEGPDREAVLQRADELAGGQVPASPVEPDRDPGKEASGGSGLGVAGPTAVLLGILTVLLAVLIAVRVGNRGLPPAGDPGGGPGADGEGRQPVSALERRAAEAAHAGNHALAVRLRFRAGLQALAAAGALELRPSLTAGEAARAIRSEEMNRLTATFERVIYGGAVATESDSTQAQRGWRAVLEAVRG